MRKLAIQISDTLCRMPYADMTGCASIYSPTNGIAQRMIFQSLELLSAGA